MRKQVHIQISVGRSEPLTTEECVEVAEAFNQACPMFIGRLRQGAVAIPLILEVGSDSVVENRCRICDKTETELLKEGITLMPFDPTADGVRPIMEAAALTGSTPSDRIVFWDCGCLGRASAAKAELDRQALARRAPLGPIHQPHRTTASSEELQEQIKELQAAIAKLTSGGH